MFNNVGVKIKMIAKWSCYLLSAGAIIGGIACIISDPDMAVLGVLIMLVGPLVAWLTSLFTYGFGEMVDTAIVNRNESKTPAATPAKPAAVPAQAKKPTPPPAAKPAPKAEPAEPKVDVAPYLGKRICSGCGLLIEKDDVMVCPECGCKYLGKITKANAMNVIPNIEKH